MILKLLQPIIIIDWQPNFCITCGIKPVPGSWRGMKKVFTWHKLHAKPPREGHNAMMKHMQERNLVELLSQNEENLKMYS